MTIRTFLNEAARKSNKGLRGPRRVCEWPGPLTEKVYAGTGSTTRKCFSTFFLILFLFSSSITIPVREVNCFGHLSNRDQNNWTGYVMLLGKRLIIIPGRKYNDNFRTFVLRGCHRHRQLSL